MGRPSRCAPEVRERAVRMVFDHESEYDSQWAAIRSIWEEFGMTSETLRGWVCPVCCSLSYQAAPIAGSYEYIEILLGGRCLIDRVTPFREKLTLHPSGGERGRNLRHEVERPVRGRRCPLRVARNSTSN